MPTMVNAKVERSEYGPSWNLVYKIYPKLLRVFETCGFHTGRQPFVVGRLSARHDAQALEVHLKANGFTPAVLAWKDSGEVLSMRKIDKHIFQWHIRLHSDGEIRGHYEYSSEGNPWGHVSSGVFEPDKDFFLELLQGFLV
jgi:hypothetical protein